MRGWHPAWAGPPTHRASARPAAPASSGLQPASRSPGIAPLRPHRADPCSRGTAVPGILPARPALTSAGAARPRASGHPGHLPCCAAPGRFVPPGRSRRVGPCSGRSPACTVWPNRRRPRHALHRLAQPPEAPTRSAPSGPTAGGPDTLCTVWPNRRRPRHALHRLAQPPEAPTRSAPSGPTAGGPDTLCTVWPNRRRPRHALHRLAQPPEAPTRSAPSGPTAGGPDTLCTVWPNRRRPRHALHRLAQPPEAPTRSAPSGPTAPQHHPPEAEAPGPERPRFCVPIQAQVSSRVVFGPRSAARRGLGTDSLGLSGSCRRWRFAY